MSKGNEGIFNHDFSSMDSKINSIQPPSNIRIKIISMGESEVGKSCLIKRYCEERVSFSFSIQNLSNINIPEKIIQFIPRYVSTIGVDFGVKKVTINGKEIRANFWDLSGHPEFFEVRNEFYKDSQGVCTFRNNFQFKNFPLNFKSKQLFWNNRQYWFMM